MIVSRDCSLLIWLLLLFPTKVLKLAGWLGLLHSVSQRMKNSESTSFLEHENADLETSFLPYTLWNKLITCLRGRKKKERGKYRSTFFPSNFSPSFIGEKMLKCLCGMCLLSKNILESLQLNLHLARAVCFAQHHSVHSETVRSYFPGGPITLLFFNGRNTGN